MALNGSAGVLARYRMQSERPNCVCPLQHPQNGKGVLPRNRHQTVRWNRWNLSGGTCRWNLSGGTCPVEPVRWNLSGGTCPVEPVRWNLSGGTCPVEPVRWNLSGRRNRYGTRGHDRINPDGFKKPARNTDDHCGALPYSYSAHQAAAFV